jgi:hypothetical protein
MLVHELLVKDHSLLRLTWVDELIILLIPGSLC